MALTNFYYLHQQMHNISTVMSIL